MAPPTEFRRGPDRRSKPRGGRRAEDKEGFAPLVMVVGEERASVEKAEAILARLKFAVSTSGNAPDAVRVLPDLRPDIIVVDPRHEPLFRAATNVPVVCSREDPDALIDDIRRALRVTPIR
jgi:hypothetical protein